MKPIGTNILVEVLDPETKTAGGLYIPDQSQEASQMGKVLETGSRVREISKGDTVLFTKFSGSAIEGKLVINEIDVLAVVQ